MRCRRVQRANRRVVGTSADGLKDDETQHEVESLIVYEHRVLKLLMQMPLKGI
jgi:hypothetical protein